MIKESDYNKYAIRSRRPWLHAWVQNSYKNWETIRTMIKEKRAFDLGLCINKHHDKPAIVIGSGSTLEDALPLLQRWEGLIYAPATAFNILAHAGIQADYIIAYDANKKISQFLSPEIIEKAALVTYPLIHPEVISTWNNSSLPLLLFLPEANPASLAVTDMTITVKDFAESAYPDAMLINYFDDPVTVFLNAVMALSYQDTDYPIRTRLAGSACAPNLSCCIANLMGCSPIFLVGVDNCFFENITNRSPNVACGGARKYLLHNGVFTKQPVDDIPDTATKINGFLTTPAFYAYTVNLYLFAHTHRMNIVNTFVDRKGMVDFYQWEPLDNVIKSQGKIEVEPEDSRIARIKKYCIDNNIYEIIKDGGSNE